MPNIHKAKPTKAQSWTTTRPTPTNSTFTHPTVSTSTHPTNTTVNPAEAFFTDLLNQIPLPRWAVFTIFSAGGLLMVICCLCVCMKCCCKGKKKKKKKKDELMNLKEVNGKSTSALVCDAILQCTYCMSLIFTVAHQIPSDGAEANYGSTKTYRGKLLYSLEYDAALSELIVGIKQASGLKAMDFGGSSDPYVKVYVLPSKTKICETKVFKSTLNPIFNEQFSFQISKSALLKSTAVMKVFDFDRFSKHEIIGELRLELCSVDWNHVMEEWQELAEPPAFEEENLGEICFSLRYVPTASKLTVVILEAKNLKSMDMNGSSDPYVKVQLALDKRKWRKRKTSVKKKTLSPYFNESFTFDVALSQIQRVNLVISVWDHDAVTRNDAMGKIYLGCDATGNQLRHWADMLSNPRRPVAQWHTLLTPEQVNATLTLKKRIPIPGKLVESSQRFFPH